MSAECSQICTQTARSERTFLWRRSILNKYVVAGETPRTKSPHFGQVFECCRCVLSDVDVARTTDTSTKNKVKGKFNVKPEHHPVLERPGVSE
jgi:hypothetical protein